MLHYKPNEACSITYPYCYKHKLFDYEELKKIITYCDLLPKEIGGTGNSSQLSKRKDIRKSNVAWVEYNDECKWFYDKLASAIDTLNQNFYEFDLVGFCNYQFTEYKAADKGKYDWHMDTVLGNNSERLTRKLSVTLLLNDNFDGGQFEFFDLEKEYQPKMRAGTLIVFPSFMVHRVTEITKGVRNSLVCWCVGQKFK